MSFCYRVASPCQLLPTIPPTYGTLTLFRAPLLGLLPTMLFSDFQNFFLAYVSANRPSVHHLD